MQLNVVLTDLPYPVSTQLLEVLNHALQAQDKPLVGHDVIFNFRDKSYSAETGGYHPVEIRLYLHHGVWCFDYITDFCWVGGLYPELAKEIDFNFPDGSAYLMYTGYSDASECDELYRIWESNFVAYYRDQVFDEVVVTTSD